MTKAAATPADGVALASSIMKADRVVMELGVDSGYARLYWE